MSKKESNPPPPSERPAPPPGPYSTKGAAKCPQIEIMELKKLLKDVVTFDRKYTVEGTLAGHPLYPDDDSWTSWCAIMHHIKEALEDERIR